jgi:hypothetical protein
VLKPITTSRKKYRPTKANNQLPVNKNVPFQDFRGKQEKKKQAGK